MIGIYKITNKINGKVYIGQSVNIKQRWKGHRRDAKTDNQLPLYRSIRKYGIENFSFEVIEECSVKQLDEREIYWIKYYDSQNKDKGYNITSGGSHGGHGVKLNEELVKEIKDLIINSNTSLGDIAGKYGISLTTIKDIN